jgi:DNA-binding response OmpR family regulator
MQLSVTGVRFLAQTDSRPPESPVSPAPPPRICHIGHATAQWMEIRRNMAQRNVDVVDVVDVDRLLEQYSERTPTLIIVSESEESQLPHELCGDIRRDGYTGPLLAITGANDPVDSILALESGADVCLPTDADPRAAVAQIRALLRWSDHATPAANQADDGEDAEDVLRIGELTLRYSSRECEIGDNHVDLSGCEFQLLWKLATHAGNVVSREELRLVLGHDGARPSHRSVDCYIARLRKELGHAGGKHIKTIRSVGYLISKRFAIDSTQE